MDPFNSELVLRQGWRSPGGLPGSHARVFFNNAIKEGLVNAVESNNCIAVHTLLLRLYEDELVTPD